LLERKTELLYCLERLRSARVSLVEVVDYYLLHRANKGDPTLEELVAQFLDEKKRVGQSRHYEQSMRYSIRSFMEAVGREKRVGEITRQQIADYVYSKDVGDVTKRGILTHLSVLFNFAIREDLLGTNPMNQITRPSVKFHKPNVLRPVAFETLLKRCLEYDWSERLVVFALVGFCGIRIEEACRLKWSNINLQNKIVEVPATVAKKAQFRNNPIPENAMEWLKLVEDMPSRLNMTCG
jgi:site-specific recombinase XerD